MKCIKTFVKNKLILPEIIIINTLYNRRTDIFINKKKSKITMTVVLKTKQKTIS